MARQHAAHEDADGLYCTVMAFVRRSVGVDHVKLTWGFQRQQIRGFLQERLCGSSHAGVMDESQEPRHGTTMSVPAISVADTSYWAVSFLPGFRSRG